MCSCIILQVLFERTAIQKREGTKTSTQEQVAVRTKNRPPATNDHVQLDTNTTGDRTEATSPRHQRRAKHGEIKNWKGNSARCSLISRAFSQKWHSRVMRQALKGKQPRSLDVALRLNLIPALCPCRNKGARRQTAEK